MIVIYFKIIVINQNILLDMLTIIIKRILPMNFLHIQYLSRASSRSASTTFITSVIGVWCQKNVATFSDTPANNSSQSSSSFMFLSSVEDIFIIASAVRTTRPFVVRCRSSSTWLKLSDSFFFTPFICNFSLMCLVFQDQNYCFRYKKCPLYLEGRAFGSEIHRGSAIFLPIYLLVTLLSKTVAASPCTGMA